MEPEEEEEEKRGKLTWCGRSCWSRRSMRGRGQSFMEELALKELLLPMLEKEEKLAEEGEKLAW